MQKKALFEDSAQSDSELRNHFSELRTRLKLDTGVYNCKQGATQIDTGVVLSPAELTR